MGTNTFIFIILFTDDIMELQIPKLYKLVINNYGIFREKLLIGKSVFLGSFLLSAEI